MKLNAQTPKITLNKAFLKQRPLRSEIEAFKANLKTLLSKVPEAAAHLEMMLYRKN